MQAWAGDGGSAPAGWTHRVSGTAGCHVPPVPPVHSGSRADQRLSLSRDGRRADAGMRR